MEDHLQIYPCGLKTGPQTELRFDRSMRLKTRLSESFEGPKRCESLGGHRKFTMTILTLVVAVGFVEAFLIDH